MLAFCTQDSGEPAGTGTFFSSLKTAGYDRAFGIWNQDERTYPACGWVGSCAPFPAGSLTWKFKNITGTVNSNQLTPTEISNLEGNNANLYVKIAGLSITTEGVTCEGEFIDIMHGTDSLSASIQEDAFGVLAKNKKMGYVDSSVDAIKGVVRATLGRFATPTLPLLDPDSLDVGGPAVADVDPADRAARLLPDLTFNGRYQGAIHKVNLVGTLSV
jgi:hypothetical protein